MAQAQGLPGNPLIQSAKQPGQFREPGLVRQDGLTAAGVALASLCQILGQVTYLSRGGGIGRGDGVEGLDATAAHPAERAILDVVSPSQPLAGVERYSTHAATPAFGTTRGHQPKRRIGVQQEDRYRPFRNQFQVETLAAADLG
jgi:hypothetical protein